MSSLLIAANNTGGTKGKSLGEMLGDLTGSNRAAEAAEQSAMARQAALQEAVLMAGKGLADTAGRAQGQNSTFAAILHGAKSPQELQALTKSLEQQSSALERQSQLFASIDPAVLEASQQALKLMQGEEARSLGPLKNQRAQQRQALLDRLREQLGPGAETSTAGMQALNQFDQESAMVMNNAQQQSLSQLFGMAQSGATSRGALNEGAQGIANIGNAFGNANARSNQTKLGALAGMQNNNAMIQRGFETLVNAQGGFAAGAGAQYVGDQLRGQAQNQFINDRIQAGEQVAAGAAGGASKGAACCFIMLEARYGDGTMDSVVRRFRDEHMTDRNKRGYYKLAEVVVPLMRKYPLVKSLIRFTMTDPLVSYGKYHYGQGKFGRVFAPVKRFWLGLFDYLGNDHKFIRENGEVV